LIEYVDGVFVMKEEMNFGLLFEEYSNLENAMIVIIPVAYDATSTWMKGAKKGPAAIIEASANMELYDIETYSAVYKRGIFTEAAIQGDISAMEIFEAVRYAVKYYLKKDKFVVVIGGEHSVSIGSIKAHSEKYDNLTVLQLDAHLDLRDEFEDSKYNHACVMARVKELCPIVQVGIRSMGSSEKQFANKENIFLAKDIYNKSEWIEKVVSQLPENVYVTIDLNVFDPSIMPSTGTPEPGGF
jgi:agmatinase